MKLQFHTGLRLLFTTVLITIITLGSSAQSNKIDWANDTLSKADALGAKKTYLNTIRGSGQTATEQINLSVGKLKEIMDACAANNIANVSVMIIALRQSDVSRYRKNNPGTTASDSEIKGSQMLVIKVPRSAFAGKAAANLNSPVVNSLPLSLLGAGLVMLKENYQELPFATESLYFSFGSICPPPASCDTEDIIN